MSYRDRVRAALRGVPAYHVPKHDVRVKLDANESPFVPPRALSAAIAGAIADVELNRYPDPRATSLRAAVAQHLGVDGERLVIGNGSDELIELLCAAYAEPLAGDRAARMVYPGPSFVVYKNAAAANGMEVVEAPLGPRFEPQLAPLLDAVARARPSLVFVATPNNPTGTVWSERDLRALIAAADGALVVIDEAYWLYGGSDHLHLVDEAENVALLRTYSKFGLAALRIGVLYARPDVIAEVEKVRGPYNLGTLQQRAATVAITRFLPELTAHVDELIGERERLVSAIAALRGIEVFPSGANLLMVRVADAPSLFAALLARSILVRLFDRGALAGCLRITVGTREENDQLLAALTELFRP